MKTFNNLDFAETMLRRANDRVESLHHSLRELEQKLDKAEQDAAEIYEATQKLKADLGEITDSDELDVEDFCPDVDGADGRW